MLVLGIDCSTTASKVVAWDLEGLSVAEGRATFALENPAADAWEQDAEAWWSATLVALAECVHALGSRASEVRALCVTHQRETFVLTDADSKPLHPALVWMDARGIEQVEIARTKLGALFHGDVSPMGEFNFFFYFGKHGVGQVGVKQDF